MKTTKYKFEKTLRLIFSVLIAGICILSSCSKDNGDENSKNYVTLDGKRYSMKSVVYDDFPNDILYNSFALSIESNSPRGELAIHFYKKLFAELGSGAYTLKEYQYNNPGDTYNPNQHFGAGDFYYDYDTEFPFSSSRAKITSGTVTITKSGNNITMDLIGITNKGTIEAHYEGIIKSRVQ